MEGVDRAFKLYRLVVQSRSNHGYFNSHAAQDSNLLILKLKYMCIFVIYF